MFRKNKRGSNPPEVVLHPKVHTELSLYKTNNKLKSFSAAIEHLMEHQMTPEFKQEYDNLAKNYGKIAKDYARRGNVITNLIEILVKNGIMNLDVNDLSSLNKDEVGWLIEKGINIDEGVTVVNG